MPKYTFCNCKMPCCLHSCLTSLVCVHRVDKISLLTPVFVSCSTYVDTAMTIIMLGSLNMETLSPDFFTPALIFVTCSSYINLVLLGTDAGVRRSGYKGRGMVEVFNEHFSFTSKFLYLSLSSLALNDSSNVCGRSVLYILAHHQTHPVGKPSPHPKLCEHKTPPLACDLFPPPTL